MVNKGKKNFEESLLEVRRVTRVTTGGRRLGFRAVMVVGNQNGKVWVGVWKAKDVIWAIKKSSHDAYKNIVEVPIQWADTVPYQIDHKYKAAQIRLIPASGGTGMKAGSAVRTVLELAGYNNILSKILGTNNKLNNALATIEALQSFKTGRYGQNFDDDTNKDEKEDKKKENKDS